MYMYVFQLNPTNSLCVWDVKLMKTRTHIATTGKGLVIFIYIHSILYTVDIYKKYETFPCDCDDYDKIYYFYKRVQYALRLVF